MSRPLHRFLGRADALARLQEHASRLRRLQGTLEAALPPQLASQCQVANLKDDVLVLAASNGAAAVRLKQMLPSLLEHFLRAGHALGSIRVKVGTPQQAAWRPPTTERRISAAAKSCLEEFAASLPADSPLRASMERLAQRSRQSGS